MAENEKQFATGFNFERRDNAPDFVIGRLSVNAGKAMSFLQDNRNERGWVNMNILKSRNGTYYVELDTWQPKQQNGQWTPKPEEPNQDDVEAPF